MKKGILFFMIICAGVMRTAYPANEMVSVFNLPTARTTGDKILLLDIGHRYIDVNKHTTNINTTFGFGLADWADIYAGYAFKNKDIIGSAKINFMDDLNSDSAPFSFALAAGAGYKDTNQINNAVSMSYTGEHKTKAVTVLDNNDRTSAYCQMIVEKHLFTNRVAVSAVPVYAYNTNFYEIESKEDYSVGCGLGLSIFVTDRFALCGEGVLNIYGFAFKYMNYNAGIKYAGYRHTFAIWVSNCSGYSPVEYVVGNPELSPKFSAAFTREFDL